MDDLSAAVASAPAVRAPPELTIVVPTFNERDNIRPLLGLIAKALKGDSYEVVFVDDDSQDGTLQELQSVARSDPAVRYIHRIGRRGLSSAVVEGMLSSSAPYLAVIDADLQHDETLLPDMLAVLRGGKADVVVGSRYVEGGGMGEWDASRQFISRTATRIAKLIIRAELTDPMSGFFMLTREAFAGAMRNLSGQGYKILLDIFASHSSTLRLRELPYEFRTRQHGESKLDALVTWEYLMLVADKLFGRLIPVRFLMFLIVGGLGVFVHFGVLTLLLKGLNADFQASTIIATISAMTFNFFLNNLLTYRDRRLKGIWRITKGLFSFYVVCSLGAVANVGVATALFDRDYVWWGAGLAGVLVGSVWNYAATSLFTWRQKK
ncbi:glycosyltransferase family 2 protein [Emcibacter sp. SYSU 3D8]|uniref:glycosyltransferase family 2 protein n=1 Tax=Emcibacter sp. SYSU 3D8 TaxID=3133969 RepID=UPI0031FE6F46